jgi:oligoribonuclease
MKNILWVDLEMTGLEPEESVIIEFAAIVTGLDFQPLDQYHAIVYQTPEVMAGMNDWVRRHHGESGLLAQVHSGVPLDQVERDVLAFIARHFADERPILAGNSIHQDRKFIDKYMPLLAEKLHYRMLDVSSFKLVFRDIYQVTYTKNQTHRALDDISESIEELKCYLAHVNLTDPS